MAEVGVKVANVGGVELKELRSHGVGSIILCILKLPGIRMGVVLVCALKTPLSASWEFWIPTVSCTCYLWPCLQISLGAENRVLRGQAIEQRNIALKWWENRWRQGSENLEWREVSGRGGLSEMLPLEALGNREAKTELGFSKTLF